MNSNFLEVDESLFQKKFLLNNLTTAEDGDEDNENGPGIFGWGAKGGGDSIPQIPIVTPSQRREASQCKFIIPKPGVCVKTKDLKTGQKFFINFCHSDDVPEPQLYYSDDELRKILSCGTDGEIDNVRIPISIGEKNVVTDTAERACLATDVIMNSKFFNTKFQVSEIYQTFFIIVGIEGVESKHKVTLDRDKYKILKAKKVMGKLSPQFVKQKAGIQEISSRGDGRTTKANAGALPFPKTAAATNDSSKIRFDENELDVEGKGAAAFLEPVQTKRFVQEVMESKEDSQLNCIITQHSEELATASVKIPNLLNPKKLTVTVGADRLIVESPVGSLDIFLSLDLHQEKCRAEYDPATSLLSLHLPLVVKP